MWDTISHLLLMSRMGQQKMKSWEREDRKAQRRNYALCEGVYWMYGVLPWQIWGISREFVLKDQRTDSTADVLTGVYCSSPDQQKEADEPYFMLCRKYHSHRPQYSWETSTTPICVGRAVWLCTRHPGDFWKMLKTISWCRWLMNQLWNMLCHKSKMCLCDKIGQLHPGLR